MAWVHAAREGRDRRHRPLACHMAPSGSLETGHDWENAVKAFTDLTASYPVDLPGQPGLSELAMGVYSSYAFGQDWDGTVNDCIAKYDPAYARVVGAYLCEALRGLTRLQETKVGTEIDSADWGPCLRTSAGTHCEQECSSSALSAPAASEGPHAAQEGGLRTRTTGRVPPQQPLPCLSLPHGSGSA